MDPFDMSDPSCESKVTYANLGFTGENANTGTTAEFQEVFGCCSSKNPCEIHLKQCAEGWQKLHDTVLKRLKALEAENLQLAKENKELQYWRREMEQVMEGIPKFKVYKAK